MPDEILSARLVASYEEHERTIVESAGQAAAGTVKLWSSLYHIWHSELWRAKYRIKEDWIDHLEELELFGVSRANLFRKCAIADGLVQNGADPEVAGVAVALIPGASERLALPGAMASATKGQPVDQFVTELLTLTPGQALTRVQEESGNSVKMWIKESDRVACDKFLVVISRVDEAGYSEYVANISIHPNRSDHVVQKDLAPAVSEWLENKLNGH